MADINADAFNLPSDVRTKLAELDLELSEGTVLRRGGGGVGISVVLKPHFWDGHKLKRNADRVEGYGSFEIESFGQI